MGDIRIRRISGGLDVGDHGTVTRGGWLRPSKVLRDTGGRTFRVEARARVSTLTDESGARLGEFRRNFWTRHGVVEWGTERYDFKAGVWSSTYQLLRGGEPVARLKLQAFGGGTLWVADDLDRTLVLFVVALGAITKAYTTSAAAAGSGG